MDTNTGGDAGGYLIPANSKKGLLIMGMFNPVDLIIFGAGVGTTLLLLILLNPSTLLITDHQLIS
jgi:hypothetical protein